MIRVTFFAAALSLVAMTDCASAQYVDRTRGWVVRQYMGDVNRQAQFGANYGSAFTPSYGNAYGAIRNGVTAVPGYVAGTAFKLQGRAIIDVGRAGDAYQYLYRRGGTSWGR
jgi:hypothetical protein